MPRHRSVVVTAALWVREQQHGADSAAFRAESPQLLHDLAMHRHDPGLADFVMLGAPTDRAVLEVHIVPAERQDTAQATPRAPRQENQQTQERMDRGRDRQQRANRALFDYGPLGVFLGGNLVFLHRVPGEERLTPLVLLAGPVQRGLGDPPMSIEG